MLWGIDRDAWISIWSGALGAIPAAVLAALVAVAVLRRSNRKQQELVELQLEEQRREAALVRERSAIADVMISVQDFVPATHTSMQSVREQYGAFRSAVLRWQLELGRGGLGDELQKWPTVLLGVGTIARVEEEKAGFGDTDRAHGELNKAISAVCTVGIEWQRSDAGMRKVLVQGLSRLRREMDTYFAQATAVGL